MAAFLISIFLHSCGKPVRECRVIEEVREDSTRASIRDDHLIFFGAGFYDTPVRITFRDRTAFIGRLTSNSSAQYTGVSIDVMHNGRVLFGDRHKRIFRELMPVVPDSARTDSLVKVDIGNCAFNLVLRTYDYIRIQREDTAVVRAVHSNRRFGFF